MKCISANGTQAFRLAAHWVYESLAWDKLFLTRATSPQVPADEMEPTHVSWASNVKLAFRNYHIQRVISKQELVQKPPTLVLPLDLDYLMLRVQVRLGLWGCYPSSFREQWGSRAKSPYSRFHEPDSNVPAKQTQELSQHPPYGPSLCPP